MFTFYKKSQKGQGLVEYALMLAIIIGSGWGIYSQTGVADSIKNVFGNASSLMETVKKDKKPFAMEAVLKRLNEMQERYINGNLNNGINYNRGLFSSVWLKPEDEADDKVKSLASELGATMWTYYNDQKFGSDGGGLYWTTENLDSVKNLTSVGIGWSKETVLSYRYDNGKYSVIKNHVWLKQPGADGNKHNGLAQQTGAYGKPAGTTLGTYDTYEEAQKVYNDAKKQNKGDYIYRGTTQTK